MEKEEKYAKFMVKRNIEFSFKNILININILNNIIIYV